MSHETRLRGIVLISLIGLFVAVYLLLYQMGFYGALMCGAGFSVPRPSMAKV